MKKPFFCISLLSLFFISCSTGNKTTQQNIAPLKSYLALGDSYTVGELVKTEMTFPYLLVDEFNANEHSFNAPTVIAVTGWRTDQLLDSMKYIEVKYDLVSVLIGVNNQYQGIEIAQFRNEVKLILEKAVQLSKTKEKGVFAYSIPDYSVMPMMRGKNLQTIAAEIKTYSSYFKETCKQLGIKFYDITPFSQMAKDDTELIADDKLHPSGKMYDLWVQKTASSIRANHIK
ncbi:MAG: SGNH/GDSL hydrolase family protein [Flavobacteriales bacterium]|nr:SGNH/GDSL hydrolase family protein [Flavobacteriales bacterium]